MEFPPIVLTAVLFSGLDASSFVPRCQAHYRIIGTSEHSFTIRSRLRRILQPFIMVVLRGASPWGVTPNLLPPL